MRERGIELDTGDEQPLIDQDQETQEQEILTELNQSPADVRYHVRVCRVLQEGQREPFLFEGDASVTLKGIQERLQKLTKAGEVGTYRVRIIRNSKLWRRFDIAVEGQPETAAPPAVPEMTTGLEALARALNENSQRQTALIERLLNERNQPQILPPSPPDPFQMLERVSTIFANMKQSDGGGSMEGMMTAFTKGIELAAHATGEGREKGVFDLISEMAPAFVELLKSRGAPPQAAQVVPGPGNPALRRPQFAAPAFIPNPGPVNPEAITPENVTAVIKSYTDYLMPHAAKLHDPGLYAEWLLDNLPEALIPGLLQPGIIEQLAAIDPRVNNHRPWFTKVLAEMVRMTQEELNQYGRGNGARADIGEPAIGNHPHPGRPGGDEGNAETHAGVG